MACKYAHGPGNGPFFVEEFNQSFPSQPPGPAPTNSVMAACFDKEFGDFKTRPLGDE